MSTSTDDILHLRASEAAIEALRGQGFSILANSYMAGELTELVKTAVRTGRPKLASLSGSAEFIREAMANVDRVVGQLTPAQQAAAKAGIDPRDAAAVQAYTARWGSEHGARIHLAARGDSGARFDRIDGIASSWSSPAGIAKMRDYAVQIGIPWATNNPELLRLGPAALQVLADTHMRQSVYERLTKESGFAARDVVGIARWAKENGRDASELGTAIANVNKGLNAEERREHNAAIIGVTSAKPGEEDAARRTYDQTIDNLATKHPELKPKIEKERSQFQKKVEQVNATEQRANRKEAAATVQQAKTDAKEQKVDDSRAKMADLLKKRQETAPKPAAH